MTKETAEALNQFSLQVINALNVLGLQQHPIEFEVLMHSKRELDHALWQEADGKASGDF